MQWHHLLYCCVISSHQTDKSFTFSCPYSKYFCLLIRLYPFGDAQIKMRNYSLAFSTLFFIYVIFFSSLKTNHLLYNGFWDCSYNVNSEADICFLNAHSIADVQVSESIMYFKCVWYHNYEYCLVSYCLVIWIVVGPTILQFAPFFDFSF